MKFLIVLNLLLVLLGFLVLLLQSRIVTLALWVILLGILGNQVAVVANGGKMPVAEGSIPIEIRQLEMSATHQLVTETTRYKALVDFIHVQPLESVLSVGDILITCAVVLPSLWGIRRFLRHKKRNFFEKNRPLSYSVAFLSVLTPFLAIFLEYWK